MKSLIIIICVTFPLFLFSQFEVNENIIDNTTIKVSQSSQEYQYDASRAIDGRQSTFSSTQMEDRAYFDIELTANNRICGINISAVQLQNVYIYVSKVPFTNYRFDRLNTDPWVDYLYYEGEVEGDGSNESMIQIPNLVGRYIRIACGTTGARLRIRNINILTCGPKVNPEICDNGTDDDGDGRIDCDDSDCGSGVLGTFHQCPSCSTCADGSICVVARAGDEIQINGQTIPLVPVTIFGIPIFNIACVGNLGVATYDIGVTNSTSGCIETVTQQMSNCGVPTGGPHINPDGTIKIEEEEEEEDVELRTSDCDNNDFEDDSFEGWIGSVGLNIGGNLGVGVPGLEIPRMHEIVSTGISDPNAPVGNPGPTFGEGMVRMGNLVRGRDYATLTKCFRVDASNEDSQLAFALVLDNPNDNNHQIPDDLPFFEYRIIDENTGADLLGPVNINSLDGRLTDIAGSNWKFIPWSCEAIDFNQFSGMDICVELTVAGCGQFTHAGYAYVDIVCDPNSAISDPLDLSLDVDTDGCGLLKIDASSTVGAPKAFWTLSRVNIATGEDDQSVRINAPDSQNLLLEDVIVRYQQRKGGILNCDDHRLKIELTVEDACGNADSISEEIDIPCSQWYSANPNVMDLNNPSEDEFSVFFGGAVNNGETNFTCDPASGNDSPISYFRLLIFDEWGNKAFDQEVQGSGLDGTEIVWDGTFDGTPVVQGVYVFEAFVVTECPVTSGCYDCAPDCDPPLTNHPSNYYYVATGNLKKVKDKNNNDIYAEVLSGDITVIN